MKIIGISGLARSGKDSFYELSKSYLDNNNVKHERLAFADELKNECDPFLMKNVGISAFTEDDREKEIIRPLLVTYGTHIRRKLNPRCWIDKIEPKIKQAKNKHVFFVTDVRFKNEIDWIHEMGGLSVHVTRNGIVAPNEEELRIREKEIRSKEDQQKIESERLTKKDEELVLVAKELREKEKQLKMREEEQNRKDIDLKVREEEQAQKEIREQKRKNKELKVLSEEELTLPEAT